MASPEGEDVYATLLLSDNYLPGALILAHSLRDAGTTKKLAVLYTAETVSVEVTNELNSVFDYAIPVQCIKNGKPANLYLMDRPDLHSAFTKVNLWKLTQFRKIVYVDADVLALRAPDELFDLPHPFSAAPDIGWPDIFNTGVMALTPNMGDYQALLAMAESGASFDGADQGLLNMYFKDNYDRLSFTYNVTPSAHYQYLPAYRHFQSSINMVHFIGRDKPWFLGRNTNMAGTPYGEMVGRWFAVYDKHYQVSGPRASQHASELLKYFVKGEFNPTGEHTDGESPSHGNFQDVQNDRDPHSSKVDLHDGPQEYSQHQGQDTQNWQPGNGWQPAADVEHHHQNLPYRQPSLELSKSGQESQAEARVDQARGRWPPMQSWDAQRQAPPAGSKPEAENFPQERYEMSQDTAPFVPHERYLPHSQKPPPIFPWETHQPAPSRVFWDDDHKSSDAEAPPGELSGLPESQEPAEPSIASSVTDPQSEPATPTTPKANPIQGDIWSSFDRTNAWDDVPEIQRYVQKLESHQRRKSQIRLGNIATDQPAGEESFDKQRLRVTDFPSEHERPSLPVTPAPVRSKPKTWVGPGDAELPVAQGVPSQADWDPIAQLRKLSRQQPEVVTNDPKEPEKDKHVTGQGGKVHGTGVSEDLLTVLSPQPVKGAAATDIVKGMLDKVDSKAPGAMGVHQTSGIPEPSYTGPGPAWEKGENVPAQM